MQASERLPNSTPLQKNLAISTNYLQYTGNERYARTLWHRS